MVNFSSQEIADIRHATNRNAHTEARILIAKKIHSKTLPSYRRILAKQTRDGSLMKSLK